MARQPGGRLGHGQAHAVVHEPLGTNMLAADAVEYAEVELDLTSFDQGKPMDAPGIRRQVAGVLRPPSASWTSPAATSSR